MVRAAFWMLLAFTGIGFAAAMALVVAALAPEPGANMVLMGLPLVAAPIALCAAAALLAAEAARNRLSEWERWIAWIACGLALGVFSLLFLLG